MEKIDTSGLDRAFEENARRFGGESAEDAAIAHAESTPTPGPWHFAVCDGEVWIEDFHAEAIADVCPGINCVANARLLSAAPYLLSTLIHARNVIRQWHEIENGTYGEDDSAWRIYEKNAPEMRIINDAILKATKP